MAAPGLGEEFIDTPDGATVTLGLAAAIAPTTSHVTMRMIENTPVIRPQRCSSDAILLVASGVRVNGEIGARHAEVGWSSAWLTSRSSSSLLIRGSPVELPCVANAKLIVESRPG